MCYEQCQGDDYIHQLNLIFQLLGTPAADDLDWVSNEKALQYVQSLPKQAPVPFDKLFAKKPIKPNALGILCVLVRCVVISTMVFLNTFII